VHGEENRKMEGGFHGQRWTTWFLRTEGVKPLLTACYLAVCGEKVSAVSTVFNCVWSLNSGKETEQAAVNE
jgi:hypothetical protein